MPVLSAFSEEIPSSSFSDDEFCPGARKKEYFLKRKGNPHDDNTWEPDENLDCPELTLANEVALKNKEIDTKKTEPKKKDNKKADTKKSKNSTESKPSPKIVKNFYRRPRGFDRNLTAEKIIGATNCSGELIFLMKWCGSDEVDLVPSCEANVKCPQIVIEFYQGCLKWRENAE
ncbi:unnamed protein product [Timema podura]|uniref:Chromo domain-containing protein n=1 Tax=Timema podura TaxID=61482 RepID=A0ABN7P304_TIMPD|nr:unnamed protein product [Timema podura]